MIDRDYERLIQDVLDGQASKAEVERLNAWLAMNEEGRTRMRELEGLFATLHRVPFVEMPLGLTDDVQQAIRARAAMREKGRTFSLGLFKPKMRLAMVFAAGIAAGVVGWGALTGILNPGAPGRERVVGTMMPTAPPQAGTVSRSWSAGDLHVHSKVWRAGASRWMRLRVEGAPAEVELRFDPAALSPAAVRQSAPGARVVLDPGRILINVTPPAEFTLEFGEKTPSEPIQVTARAGSRRISDRLPSP